MGAAEQEAWPPEHRGDAPHHGRGHAGRKLLLVDHGGFLAHLSLISHHLHRTDFIPGSSAQGPHQEMEH